MQRVRPDQLGATNEGRVIGNLLGVKTTKLAQHQTIADELLGRGITPAIEMFNDQHTQDDLDWCGGTAIDQRPRMPFGQVGFDGLEQGVVVKQVIELHEHRIQLHT